MKALAAKISFGDIPLLLYFTAFLREYFWIVPNNYVAWPLTLLSALTAWYFYIRTRAVDEHRVSISFWLIVGLPLFFLFSTRVAYPDTSFDVMTYHIVHSERALRGLVHIPGDMFFGQFPSIDPAPDVITGITRFLLGFRAGVVINFVAILWMGTVIDKILALRVRSHWVRSMLVLACVTCEFLLAEINNYMVDLLALPLLLEALWFILRPSEKDTRMSAVLPHFLLLIGMAVGLKITNFVFAAPMLAVLTYRLWRVDRRPIGAVIRLGVKFAALFIAPVFAYVLYITYRTGNPVFPLYNGIFRSPFWGALNFYDGRWGPKGLLETILWPVQMFLVPERLSELNMYTGRITIGWVLAILGLLLSRKDWRLGGLCFTMLVGTFLWSEGAGYIRYGLFLEPLAGLVCVYFIAALIERSAAMRRSIAYGIAAVAALALATQCYRAAVLSYDHEWSGRPNCFRQRGCRGDLAQLFTDRKMPLDTETQQLLANVDVWVESAPKVGGIMALARPDVPGFTYIEEYYRGTGSDAEFRDSLTQLRGKRFFTMVMRSDIDEAQQFLDRRQFTVKHIDNVDVPYFSETNKIPMLLIELEPPMPHDQ